MSLPLMSARSLGLAAGPVPRAASSRLVPHSSPQPLCCPREPAPNGRPQAAAAAAAASADQPLSGHSDAARRRAEALQRRAAAATEAQLASCASWWEQCAPSTANVRSASSPADIKAAVTGSTGPVVLDFFSSWCTACRRLHPKLMQLAEQNPAVTFVKVNAGVEQMQGLCEALGIASLPYFHFYSAGELVSHFSANLTRVDRLRTQLKALQQLSAQSLTLPDNLSALPTAFAAVDTLSSASLQQ